MRTQNGSRPDDAAPDWLPEIIDLLRTKTAHDFTLYKPGTLQRRIERRMAMAAIETDDMDRYLEMLRSDAGELDLLAKDLLINVTSFFRDRKVFDLLAEKIIPDLVRGQSPDQPLRIWIAGCSTGEETYSLAMLFLEQIAAAKRNIKLQVFASDVDPDAIAQCPGRHLSGDDRGGRVAGTAGPLLLKEEHGYRVSPELRAAVVFTVQDVLADPPFSRIDLVSCRNLLIYLRPEAQAKVISLFHFALREGGILLLGSSETIGTRDGRFELISKSERIYRHTGRSRPGEFGFVRAPVTACGLPARAGPGQVPSRQAALADTLPAHGDGDLCAGGGTDQPQARMPVFSGADRPLSARGAGASHHDLLAMVRQDMRTRLRSAHPAGQSGEHALLSLPAGR